MGWIGVKKNICIACRSQILKIQLRSLYILHYPASSLLHMQMLKYTLWFLCYVSVYLSFSPKRENVSLQDQISEVYEHGFYNNSKVLLNILWNKVKQH